MNQRPLPCVLAGFVLGEVWILQFRGTAAFAALICAAVICMMIGVSKKGSFCFFLAAIGIGMALGGMQQHRWSSYETTWNKWKNMENCQIEGKIDDIAEKEYSKAVVLDQIYVNGQKQGGKLLLYVDQDTDCVIGGRIAAEGKVEDFSEPTNPGGFDQRQYQAGRGILGVIYDGKITEIRYGSFLIKDGIYQIRKNCASFMKKHMKDEYSGIGIAMALGEKGALEEEQKNLYETAGISHVLAVSGLHMSLLGAGVYKIFRKLGFGYPVSVCSSLPCIAMYAILTGMSSSCLRAGIMLAIYLIAEYGGYYYDLPSSLSLAGILLLAEIPARLFDSGFLLSFGAILSVGIFIPFLLRVLQYDSGKKKIRDSFLSGLLITLFTLPFSLYFFYGFSLAGIFINLLVIPLMTGAVPLLFFGSLGWMVLCPEKIAALSLKLAEWILFLYDILCRTADKIRFSYVQTGFRDISFAILYYSSLFLFFLFLYFIRRKRKYVKGVTVVLMGIFLCFLLHMTGRNDSFLTVLDVGQGDGILYHSRRGEVCMIDGGSSSEKKIGQYVIRPALEYYGISHVDYWFLSHFDEDHLSGLVELLKTGYPVDHLILPVRNEKTEKQLEIEQLAKENGTQIHVMKQGDCLTLKEEIFYCLYPKEGQVPDENQGSMVLLLENATEQILLTGDIEKEAEQTMSQYLYRKFGKTEKKRYLKASHHGSANGSGEDLLGRFLPDWTIISCGLDNRYGHPAGETLDRLEKSGSNILCTMEQGAVEIRCGSGIAVFSP